MHKARISIPTENWIAMMFFAALLAGVATLFSALLITIISGALSVVAILFSFVAAALISVLTGLLVLYYPAMAASERKKKIENALPFATIYLNTISRAGFPPQDLFKMIAKFKEYGEVSEEAKKISNEVHALGLDLPSALNNAVARSPSNSWTELLAGMKTTITIGGDLGQFLSEKAKGFVADYQRRLQEFSNFLTLMIEIYITLVIVGAVFFIITTSIMVSIGGVPVALVKALNYAIVLVGLPVMTAAFLLMIKGASPME
ncbi:MAG: type II secretion system F family protein [DPANN group archaeon]|nr:type II secretion system F family protein [DPANN group archaeon]